MDNQDKTLLELDVKKSFSESFLFEDFSIHFEDENRDDFCFETFIRKMILSMDKALQELAELHDACVDTGMSYADRVAMREQGGHRSTDRSNRSIR